jgi:hypothetical protein
MLYLKRNQCLLNLPIVVSGMFDIVSRIAFVRHHTLAWESAQYYPPFGATPSLDTTICLGRTVIECPHGLHDIVIMPINRRN